GWIAFKIKVPATANYEITGLSAYVFSNGSSETEVYIVPKNEALNTTLTSTTTYGNFSTLLGSSSKYYVTRESATSFANLGISSDYLMGTANLMGDANAVQDLITIDGGVKNKKNLFLEAGTEYFLFLHNANGKKRGMPVSSITLSKPEELGEPEDEAAEGKVSFAVTTNIPGEEVTRVESLPRGQEVDMTQYMSDNQNYKFIGWMRGAYTEDDAQNESSWITIGDTYNVWTNTFLTAVYEPVTASDEKAVEFWNQNGAYLGKSTEKTYATDVKRVPTLIGFGTFKGWFIGETEKLPETFAELKAGTTNAVAQYEASAISNVTFNGNAIAGADTYDAPVELDKDSETTAWLRDGEPIAYGKTYKFNVWDATNITEGTEEIEDKVPVAILDYSENHKAYMLEYDAGAYDIVEAGIIFGKDTADIKKYTSQRKEKHHQFTVPEEGALEATGYIIYTLDGGANYKTKYVSVTTAN
ncbi:MAG: hypothetical protein IJF32_00940, partial [Oscillospiraceae bacterium]|nr:hypothetical protein [Oscillospiraceae bacterium]